MESVRNKRGGGEDEAKSSSLFIFLWDLEAETLTVQKSIAICTDLSVRQSVFAVALLLLHPPLSTSHPDASRSSGSRNNSEGKQILASARPQEREDGRNRRPERTAVSPQSMESVVQIMKNGHFAS